VLRENPFFYRFFYIGDPTVVPFKLDIPSLGYLDSYFDKLIFSVKFPPALAGGKRKV
jgi:hypothetical protein